MTDQTPEMPPKKDWLRVIRNNESGCLYFHVTESILSLEQVTLLARWHEYIEHVQAEEIRDGTLPRTR